MDDARIGRIVVVLRQRRGWRQTDLATRAGISESAVSRIEHGQVDRYTVATVRRVFKALDAAASLDVRWHGRGDLDRLLDADHASVVEAWTERHARAGWETWNEASFNIYGERGRIDLLAFHPPTGFLEVAECKTGLWDNQETLGVLDMKVRLAPKVAAQRGWTVSAVVPALIFLDGRTVRRRLTEHKTLFARYDTRGKSAHAWVRRPSAGASGLLAFVPLPNLNETGPRRAGQQRFRARRQPVSVTKMDQLPVRARISAETLSGAEFRTVANRELG